MSVSRKQQALKRRLAIAFGAPLLPDEMPTTPPVKARALAAAFGYLFPEEVTLLSVLAESLPAGAVFVNIGAGSGTSSLCVTETNPAVKAYTVDISDGGPFGGLENERNAFAETGLPLPSQILGDSHAAGKLWIGGKVDMLFVDADHSFEGCNGDIEAWHPHVVAGGIIVFHDYERDFWPEVKQAVDAAAERYGWELIEQRGTMIAFRK